MANLENPTAEESVKALAGLRNLTSFDVESFIHDQHKDYVYRWANKKGHRVEHLKLFGWQTVSRGSSAPGHGARGGTWNEGAGAWMAYGDRILMLCRRDLFEARQARKADRFKDTLIKDTNEFEETASRLGVKTFTDLED